MADAISPAEASVAFDVAEDEPLDLFLIDKFVAHGAGVENVPFSALRLTYAFYLFLRINGARRDLDIATVFLAQTRRLVASQDEPSFSCPAVLLTRLLGRDGEAELCRGSSDVEAACVNLSQRLRALTPSKQIKLFKLLELLSRGQADNAAWHVLRADTVSATKFYGALTAGASLLARPDTRSRGLADGVRFGVEHEPVVKRILEVYVVGADESVDGGLGLLIDPTSGLIGASLDLCFGLDRADDGIFWVRPGATIFEVKCRYKYLRDKDDDRVRDLLRAPTEQAIIDFILEHPIPGVEYRESGEIPSGREFLLSRDRRFRVGKRSRPGRSPDILRDHLQDLLYLNERHESQVIVFDTAFVPGETINAPSDHRVADRATATTNSTEPGDLTGDADGDGSRLESEIVTVDEDCTPDLEGRLHLYERARFRLPVFVNPRHQYYFQTLIQQYVLSQYYIKDHPDPESIDHRDLPRVSLVSAVLRRRGAGEPGRGVSVGGRDFDCEHLPLFVIVTPVTFDPAFTRDAVTTVLNNWQREIRRRTGLPIWVQNAVSEYVVSSVPRPETP